MDQQLKQRLVGTIVITALAAIFVPMLFDDPIEETGKKINELKIPELPARLQRVAAIKLPQRPSDVTGLPIKKRLKMNHSKFGKKVELSSWSIQAGVFSQQENAMALRNKLRKQGFSVSVIKDSSKKEARYKVKVGPEISKKRAEQVKRQLKQLKIDSFISENP